MKTILITTPLILLAALLMSFNPGGGGGDKCKFDFEKVDKFSGKMIRYNTIQSKNTNIDQNNPAFALEIGDKGEGIYLSTSFYVYGQVHTALQTTDTVFYKLENGSIVKIAPPSEITPTSSLWGAGVLTSFTSVAKVSKEIAQQLSTSKVVAFKYSVSGISYTGDLQEKQQEKMMKTFACLLK